MCASLGENGATAFSGSRSSSVDESPKSMTSRAEVSAVAAAVASWGGSTWGTEVTAAGPDSRK